MKKTVLAAMVAVAVLAGCRAPEERIRVALYNVDGVEVVCSWVDPNIGTKPDYLTCYPTGRK